MDPIEDILKREFPALEVDVPSIPGASDIKQDELSTTLQYIKKEKLVQDAWTLLSGINPMRKSVTYPIIFPKQERKLTFRVDWMQGPMVLIGYVQAENHVGENVTQARFYGMHLRGMQIP